MNFNIDMAKKAAFLVANVLTAIYTSLQIGAVVEKRVEARERKKAQTEGGA